MLKEKKDYYKILQVDSAAEHQVIVAAYKCLALKYHPDTNRSTDATQRMQEINLAYEILSDSAKRSSYDADRNVQYAKSRRSGENEKSTDQSTNAYRRILLFQNDFYSFSDEWIEENSPDYKAFRRNGYFHLAVMRPDWEYYYDPLIPVIGFRVYVDVQFARNSGLAATCGIVFRVTERGEYDNYYRFSFSRDGYHSLYASNADQWKSILAWRFSGHIRQNDSINTLMAEMVDD